MNYCCLQFEEDLKVDRQTGPNIRIVKIQDEPVSDPEYPYRFVITAGYRAGDKNVPCRFISHCPYCGTELKAFYRLDAYVNELDNSVIKYREDG